MLLAFDTATPLVTAALAEVTPEGTRVLAELASERPMKHAESLAPMISELLSSTGTARTDLTAVVVGTGPGPFTGLRVGLVTARTLGLALGIPVYGVCTLDVIAAQAVATDLVPADLADETSGEGFLVATDARRKEVYLAAYDARARRTDGPHVLRPADAATDRLVVGEGARLYPEAFPVQAGPAGPSAGMMARLVAGELVEITDPEPLYLRRPDALTSAERASAAAGGAR